MAPTRDGSVIAAHKNFWHVSSTPRARTSEMRAIEQRLLLTGTNRERIFGSAVFMSEDIGKQSRDCINEHHRAYFSARNDIVAEREFKRLEFVNHAFVDAFIVAAEKQKSRLRCEPFHSRLREALALWRKHHAHSGRGIKRFHSCYCVEDWLTHHHHAGSSAKRAVVYFAMLVVAEGADVMRDARQCARLDCDSWNARREKIAEESGEDGEDVDAHASFLFCLHRQTFIAALITPRHHVMELGLLAWRRIDASLLEKITAGIAWLCANREPVLNTIGVEFVLLADGDWIEPSEVFQYTTIARGALIHCTNTVEGAMGTAHSLETENDHEVDLSSIPLGPVHHAGKLSRTRTRCGAGTDPLCGTPSGMDCESPSVAETPV